MMKDAILKCFSKNNGYITEVKLRKLLGVSGEEDVNILTNSLNSLVEDGSLFFDNKKGYRLFTNELGIAFGELEVNKSGNGFVHTKDGYTIFIPHNDLNGALNQDLVIVGSIDIGTHNDYRGKIYKVVKRSIGTVIYLTVGNGLDASLIPYDKNQDIKIAFPKNQLRNLKDGEFVLVKVDTKKVKDKYLGEIDSVIGNKNDSSIDLKLIYMKNGIPIEFSNDSIEEANNMPTSVSEEELIGRIDLREKDIITIDCDSTKDRDDAVYVEKLSNGNYMLYTSISHVSHYVKPGTSLYKEASIRNTSHYPNNTCNPMFPKTLSNGICSLDEDVDRLTRTCEIEFDKDGNVVNYNIYKSVIRSRKAMSYSKVNYLLEGGVVEEYADYREQLFLMKELSDILQKRREERNYLNFDINDIKVLENSNKEIEGIVEDNNGISGEIIENFMLITGTTVAEHFSYLPFIYRVHEAPNRDTVESVIKILKESGISIPSYQNIDERMLKSILDKVSNKEEAYIVKMFLLKSMKRARYDINNIGHFALQLNNYCHFTSPIRRFTDFRIHTLLDNLDNMTYSEEEINNLENELNEIAYLASKTEKIAKEIEIEAINMAMASYMEHHIGEEYSATITEVYEYGMFAKTKNFISGKINIKDMRDDKYKYSPLKKQIIGKKKQYKIGDKIYVIVKDASKENRTINFVVSNKKRVLKKEITNN